MPRLLEDFNLLACGRILQFGFLINFFHVLFPLQIESSFQLKCCLRGVFWSNGIVELWNCQRTFGEKSETILIFLEKTLDYLFILFVQA